MKKVVKQLTIHRYFVWAYREGSEFRDEYWNEVETDGNGTFPFPFLPGGKYEIGAILSQELGRRVTLMLL